jgi:hypothetical protein
MKLYRCLIAFFLIVPFKIISADTTTVAENFKLDDMEFTKKVSSGLPTDTMWILRDDTVGRNYYDYSVCDTLRAFDSACLSDIWMDAQYCNIPQQFCNEAHCDTGDEHDSTYINFDFHTNSSGYAGFKIDWDEGSSTWDCVGFDSLILWHKGPNPGQKVTINIGSSAACGQPTIFHEIGTFEASTVWKREALALPADAQIAGNYEMQVLINTATSSTTKKNCGCGAGTGLAFLPPIWLKAMSLRRKKKRAKKVG